ncbi:hypothetical protein [Methylophilus aquaticus]|uniref:MxaK protein n=1 Tax=Methylophilus aquaticus TaxID=1971610 RepID=A0ABT9JUP4_9PROT|nr:hypothetical protein [Methylophilus aquaticus]MDP8568253.1 hypothetical protein [Methylophilus aquaticus]
MRTDGLRAITQGWQRRWRNAPVSLVCWLYGLAVCGVLLTLLAGWQWHALAERNRMLLAGQALRVRAQADDAILAYAQGVALQSTPEKALHLFYLPEASVHPRLRAQAKFAIGNLYFDWAMQHHAVEQGGAHQQQVAMIALAREAYKDALRLNPEDHDARFNLELLDRRSPDKRTQGWQSETDGVTLKPFKRNGTAMMRDNQRRGLP